MLDKVSITVSDVASASVLRLFERGLTRTVVQWRENNIIAVESTGGFAENSKAYAVGSYSVFVMTSEAEHVHASKLKSLNLFVVAAA